MRRRRYAQAILRILGVENLFEEVFSIEHTRFRPKPDAHGFLRQLLHDLPPEGHRAASWWKTSLENLRTAKRLGMKTVWVDATRSRARRGWTPMCGTLFRLPRLLHIL